MHTQMVITVGIVVTLSLLFVCRTSFSKEGNELALVNAQLLDVKTGNILRDASVVIENGKIASIQTTLPSNITTVVDMEGKYLLPGFMDGHWHGTTLEQLRRALESGVTTLRSAGAWGAMDLWMRDAVRAGYLPGPRILAAGVYIKPSLGEIALTDQRLYKYLQRPVQGVTAVREVVRVNADNGVDWIKTRSGGTMSPKGRARAEVYSQEVMNALVDEASSYELPVACHAHSEHVILIAVRAGCRSIEHGFYMTEKALREMKKYDVVWSPTYYSRESDVLSHDDYHNSSHWLRNPYIVQNMRRMMRVGHEIGIRMITSTDTRYSAQSVTRISGEIVSFVEHAGMSPLEAIQAATIISAKVYGLESVTGTIEEGLSADLIAFDHNPLEDIWVVHEPMFVMSNGNLIYHRTITDSGYVAPRVDWAEYGRGVLHQYDELRIGN